MDHVGVGRGRMGWSWWGGVGHVGLGWGESWWGGVGHGWWVM